MWRALKCGFGSGFTQPPDACFVGVNRHATVDVIADLSAMGAGGAMCFASGFLEAHAEADDGASLQNALLRQLGQCRS